MANEAQQQVYDNLFKRMLEDQPITLIPLLFPETATEVLEELNFEVLIPPRRTDRVYKSRSHKGVIVLHVEFETAANSKMDKRLLIYHSLLLEKYELPVTSIIVYPFEVSMVTPPLEELDGDKEILRFCYKTLALWQWDARKYFQERAIPLYGFLPAMEGTNDDMLIEAIDQMVKYYGNNEESLRNELLCFRTLLARAKRLPEAQLERVLRRIRMYDPFLEQDPWIKEKVAEGKAQGIAEGQLNYARNIFVDIVETRFPALGEIAKAKAAQIEHPEMLHILTNQILRVIDENAAHSLLEKRQAS